MYVSAWSQDDLEAYQRATAKLTARRPDVQFILDHWTGGAEPYYAKLQAHIVAGTVPDVVWMQGHRWQPFVRQHAFRRIDDLVRRDKLSGADIWGGAATRACVLKGATYLMPTDGVNLVIYYAKAPFERLGLNYPTEDWTMDQFYELAQRLSYGEGADRQYGLQAQGEYFLSVPWLRNGGGHEWGGEDVDPTKATFNDARVVEGVQKMYYDLSWVHRAQPTPAQQGEGAAINQGRVAMLLSGSWTLPAMWGPKAPGGGVAFDVVRVPKGKASRAEYSGTSGIAIAATTPHPDASFELQKFMVTDEAQEEVAKGGRMPGVLGAIRRVWAPLVKERYQFQNTEAFAKAFEEGRWLATPVFTAGDGYGKIETEAILPDWRRMQARGEVRATEALNEINRKVQVILDQYAAERRR
ncbi:MAG TPA: extracellular solute-binding protein [Candidatus Thermoplasmatota archaeon]|nr:extracellular solute-binding protein [Candidatus Thermoplasmatota archaeon]